jgi:hypothetical protein
MGNKQIITLIYGYKLSIILAFKMALSKYIAVFFIYLNNNYLGK